jgi:hypothetical protein
MNRIGERPSRESTGDLSGSYVSPEVAMNRIGERPSRESTGDLSGSYVSPEVAMNRIGERPSRRSTDDLPGSCVSPEVSMNRIGEKPSRRSIGNSLGSYVSPRVTDKGEQGLMMPVFNQSDLTSEPGLSHQQQAGRCELLDDLQLSKDDSNAEGSEIHLVSDIGRMSLTAGLLNLPFNAQEPLNYAFVFANTIESPDPTSYQEAMKSQEREGGNRQYPLRSRIS